MAIPKRDNYLKKNLLVIKFPHIWFNNLNSVWCIKYFFRVFILLPLGLCHLGWSHNSPSPRQLYHCVVPHLLLETVWTTPTYLSCILQFFSKIFVNILFVSHIAVLLIYTCSSHHSPTFTITIVLLL